MIFGKRTKTSAFHREQSKQAAGNAITTQPSDAPKTSKCFQDKVQTKTSAFYVIHRHKQGQEMCIFFFIYVNDGIFLEIPGL